MAKKSNRNKEEKSEVQIAMFFAILDALKEMSRPVCWSAAACFVVFYGIYKPIEVSAGQETTVKHIINWVADFKLDVLIAWSAAGAMGAGWRLERVGRLKERAEKDARNKTLEASHDSGRSSSNLSVDGERRA